MRKWLVLILVLVVLLGVTAIWLAGTADRSVPPPGEVRQEIENVF